VLRLINRTRWFRRHQQIDCRQWERIEIMSISGRDVCLRIWEAGEGNPVDVALRQTVESLVSSPAIANRTA
jgi:hypothetical protein